MALVLIVDDSPTEVHVIRTYLENNGFETDAANDGDEGLAKARHLKPDLVIMDIVMPGMNGYQATRELSRDPETAIGAVAIQTPEARRENARSSLPGRPASGEAPHRRALQVGPARESMGRDDSIAGARLHPMAPLRANRPAAPATGPARAAITWQDKRVQELGHGNRHARGEHRSCSCWRAHGGW